MDLIKIGKFIAVCRKEKNLTQAALAEKLGITDKAVSKWENGKSLPDSSIMIELCDLLSININELLKGERINMDNYQVEAEKRILEFKRKEEEQNRKILVAELIIGIVTFIMFFFMVIYGEYIAKSQPTLSAIVITTASVIFMVICIALVWVEAFTGYYKCPNCGHCHKVSFFKALMAPHIGRARKFKCPECGHKRYHKKVISED